MKKFLSSLAAMALLLCLAAPAEATFRLRIENLGTGMGVVLTDGAASDVFTPGANGLIAFVGVIDGFTINMTLGTSTLGGNPIVGYYEAIDLNSITIKGSGAGVLRIILEQDGLGAPTPDGAIVLETVMGGTNNAALPSTVTFEAFANDGNLIPTLGVDVPTNGALVAVPDLPPAGSTATAPLVFGFGPFQGTSNTAFTKTGNYSLFSVATIVFAGPGTVSFDQVTGTNPAPAGLLLVAAGAPLLGAGAWLRRRKAVVAV